jgi:hypothetical protein
MKFIKCNKISKVSASNASENEIIDENEEIIRNVKISFLGTTSSFMNEQYKP